LKAHTTYSIPDIIVNFSHLAPFSALIGPVLGSLQDRLIMQ
jgi:hypothetical protein